MAMDQQFMMYISISGEYTLARANQLAEEMLQKARDCGMNRVMVDCLSLGGQPAIMDYFNHGEYVAELLDRMYAQERLNVKFAYVGKPPLFDREKFGFTVAQNRGVKVEAFNNYDDAFAWLKQ